LAQEDLAQLKVKHQELQQNFESERVSWLNDKKILEDTIADMSLLERQSEGDRTLREGAIHQQEERVQVNSISSLLFYLLMFLHV
jgi:nucleoprotein TPR